MTGAAALSIQLLGELSVIRGNSPVQLPPSKKARALLCYLILTGRDHRRERLCSLLWDVADDPRASLRWALSRIRPVVDQPQKPRVSATRDAVRFEVHDAKVDVMQVRAALKDGPSSVDTPRLTELETFFRGQLLEGLELPEFMDFQSWLMAEREEMRALHCTILKELCGRLDGKNPQRLEYLRRLVQIDPLSAQARADLIFDLLSRGRETEAREAHRSGKRVFDELGTPCPPVLLDALGAARRELSEEPPPPSVSALRPSIPRAPGLPLIGRDAFIDDLRAALDDADCVPVLLLGEPGVGKTRIFQELQDASEKAGHLVMAGRAHEAESGRPYGPFIDALRHLEKKANSGTTIARLVQDLSGLAGGEGTRDALFAGVASLLQTSSRQQKLCLFLDDVHWCDEASVGLLSYVLRTCERDNVCVILASRDGELIDNAPMHALVSQLRRDRYLDERNISPLDEESTRKLVEIALRTEASSGAPIDTKSVYEKSSGNPLFILEIARSDGADSASLRGIVAQRLASLSPEALDLVRWASVHGSRVSLERLENQLSLSALELDGALEALEKMAILIPEEDGYAFSHDIVRSVVYGEISAPRRKLMHGRIARALSEKAEADPTLVDELAHHAVLAGDGKLAAEACVSAGRRCVRLFANRQADTIARQGLHYASELAEEAAVSLTIKLLEITFSARKTDDVEAFESQVKNLAEKALDLGLLKESRLAFTMLAHSSWEQGNWRDVSTQSHTLAQVSRAEGDQDRITAMSEAARCLALLEKDLPEAEGLLLQASSLAERLGVESAHLRDGQGLLRLHQGKLDEAARLFAQAARSAQREGSRILEFYTRSHALMLEIQRGDFAAARQLAPALEALGTKLRHGSELSFAKALGCFCDLADGDESVRDELLSHLEELRLVDAKFRLVFILGRLADFDRVAGQLTWAKKEAEESLSVAQTLDRNSEQVMARCTLADIALAEGDGPEALKQLELIDALMVRASQEARTRAVSTRKACESLR